MLLWLLIVNVGERTSVRERETGGEFSLIVSVLFYSLMYK